MLLYSLYWQKQHVEIFIQSYDVSSMAAWIDRLEFHMLGFGLEVASWAATEDPVHFTEVSGVVSGILERAGRWLIS